MADSMSLHLSGEREQVRVGNWDSEASLGNAGRGSTMRGVIRQRRARLDSAGRG